MDGPAVHGTENVPAVSPGLGTDDLFDAAAAIQSGEVPAGQGFVYDNFNDLPTIVVGAENSANNENQEHQATFEASVADEDEAFSVGEASDIDISEQDLQVAAAFYQFAGDVELLSSEDEDREALAQQTEHETNNPPSEVSDQNTIYQDDLDDAVEVAGTNVLHGIPLSVQQAPPQAIEFFSDWLNRVPAIPQTSGRTAPSVFPDTYQQNTYRNIQAYPDPTSNPVHPIQNPIRQPAFSVHQDNLDTPQQSSRYRLIAPVPPQVLQDQSTNNHLNSQLIDRPSLAQMAKMKSAAILPLADRRASQQVWSDDEKDLLQHAAHQWWYWRDNGVLPREAGTGAALIRFFEHEFAIRGFSRSFHQLKNQWSRQGRSEFGRVEQRPGADGSIKSLITSARPKARREVEVLGGIRKRSRVESEGDENDNTEGFRAHKAARQ